jgi:hypothetical protein
MKGLHRGPRFRQLWLKNRKRRPNSVGQEKRPGHADVRAAEIAKGLTLDEARRIAANIAKLPSFLAKKG